MTSLVASYNKRARTHTAASTLVSAFLALGAGWLIEGPLAAQPITADVATIVGDADENGAGDNVANPAGAPGLGSAAVNAVGGPGSNGTVRFHIEWDISGLVNPVPGAQVQITTELGGFNLDTLFFAATVDGNGTIENTDFEVAAAQVPGVVLPIDNSGPFTFDVTSQVNAALTAGFSFFVVQARAENEATLAAGGTFDRGVQIVTTCPACTNTEDEMPQLLIGEIVPPTAPTAAPTLGAVALAALLCLVAGVGTWLLRRA